MVEEHLTILRKLDLALSELLVPKLVLKYVEETSFVCLPIFSAASLGEIIDGAIMFRKFISFKAEFLVL
jgi:hypothetical protein